MKMLTAFFCAATFVVAPVPALALAAPTYHLTPLGMADGSESRAASLNEQGDVVGWVSVIPPENGRHERGRNREKDELRHAFSYSPARGLRDLRPFDEHTSEARGINNTGTTAGWTIIEGNIHATVWREHGDKTSALDIDPHGSLSLANAVNDGGIVTGEALFGGASSPHAFVYRDGERLRDIGTLGGSRSVGMTINSHGNVAGWSLTADTRHRAFFYSAETGTMHDLGIPRDHSEARGMNDANAVVGWMYNDGGRMEAFVHENDRTQNLNTLGAITSVANDINNNGVVVGWYSLDGYDRRAFIAIGGLMTDLTDLAENAGTLAGWTLVDATAVNDNGAIVGFGIDPYGVDRGFLLTPDVPTPGTLACVVWVGMIVMKRRR